MIEWNYMQTQTRTSDTMEAQLDYHNALPPILIFNYAFAKLTNVF
jgi:hypothetical protein